jgi:anaerobic selenocysteine-containing dehydrogenase
MGAITRREFLTVIGVAAGGGVLAFAPDVALKAFQASWGEDWVEVPNGPERWVASLCRQCPGGCGIRVRLIGDRPTKIEGNPLHPVNRGKLCPKGQAGLLALNDPDRIKGPLKRVGERGSGKWQKIAWDEAITLVGNHLKEIRVKKAAHTLAIMDGESSGLTKMLFERFLNQFGSPNYIPVPTGLDYGSVDAFYLMQGVNDGVVYDMEMANYIVSFESDLLQSFWSPVQVMKAFGYTRRTKGTRGKITQVESRYSITAAKADEWIPIKSGTEGVMALGMAHLIIKEGLYDKDFVEKHTFGFEDWQDPSGAARQGYKTLVLQSYSPSAVSEITGVPVETILRVAKEFATQGPALAIGTRGDIYQQMAVHALNALVGNIDKPGGILTIKNPPVLDLPAPEIDETARRGLQMTPLSWGGDGKFPLANIALSRFAETVLQGKPYNVSTLFFYNSNPLFSNQHIEGFSQAMGKIPFVVSFSPYMDDTTQKSDLILPDHTYLEKWQSNITYTFQGFPVVGMGKPVAAPRYNTRNTGDVIIEIAKSMGNPLVTAFTWKDSQDALSDSMKKLYGMNRGDLFAPELDEALLRELARRGWRGSGYKNFEEFWEGIQEKGGWWDPAYSHEELGGVFRTPSRKFEFYSQTLKQHLEKRGNDLQALKASGIEARGDQLFLPHWESKLNASPDSEKDYPFHLKIFTPLVFAGAIHANNPYIQNISRYYTKHKWNSWVEISPRAAEKLGIRDNDWVWVESPLQKLKFRAKLTPGAMPQVVNIPMGLGHKAPGRWTKGIGENAGRLMTHHTEPFTGEPMMNKTRVKVYKA